MVDDTAEIGIFGGTGIYDSEMLQNSKEITIETPYGKTSDTITIGELDGKKVAFMPRHGKKHSIPPHMINYCANIWAFKELGITRIISPSAVGSLKEEIKPGDFVLPAQFIDFTKSRRTSFSEEGKVIHISSISLLEKRLVINSIWVLTKATFFNPFSKAVFAPLQILAPFISIPI